jgi:hypothetical protein
MCSLEKGAKKMNGKDAKLRIEDNNIDVPANPLSPPLCLLLAEV